MRTLAGGSTEVAEDIGDAVSGVSEEVGKTAVETVQNTVNAADGIGKAVANPPLSFAANLLQAGSNFFSTLTSPAPAPAPQPSY